MPVFTRYLLRLTCLVYLALGSQAQAESSGDYVATEVLPAQVRHSIIKITTVQQNLDFKRPWIYPQTQSISGSGFFVGNRHILTNAHVVANSRFITVQKDGDSKQYTAYVEYIAHDADLAVVTVTEKNFFNGLKAFSFGGVPDLHSPVSAVGYPTGGEQLAVTKGIVSRIDYSLYVHTNYHYHLLIQVDSAINPGASGGPVLQKGKVIGVVFQAFRAGQNIGYIIPVPVVQRFLKDIGSGPYKGHPELGVNTIPWMTDNASAAEFHKVNEGAKIAYISSWSPYKQDFHEGDILLAIDGQEIGSDGNISLYNERISFEHLFDLKQIGESVTFKVQRKAKTLTLKLKAQVANEHPFNGLTYKKYPRFIIVGGLIFTELSQSYLEQVWGGEDWPRRVPLFLRYLQSYSDTIEDYAKHRSFVLLAGRLPHEINMYSEGFEESIISAVDQTPIYSFDDFVKSVQNPTGKFLRFGFYNHDDALFLPTEKLKESQQQIIETYRVEPSIWLDKTTDGAVTLPKESQ